MLRNLLLIGELGVLCVLAQSQLLLHPLLGLDGVEPNALQLDRELLKCRLFILAQLVLLLDRINELPDGDAPDAPLSVDHVGPGLLVRTPRALRTLSGADGSD